DGQVVTCALDETRRRAGLFQQDLIAGSCLLLRFPIAPFREKRPAQLDLGDARVDIVGRTGFSEPLYHIPENWLGPRILLRLEVDAGKVAQGDSNTIVAVAVSRAIDFGRTTVIRLRVFEIPSLVCHASQQVQSIGDQVMVISIYPLLDCQRP